MVHDLKGKGGQGPLSGNPPAAPRLGVEGDNSVGRNESGLRATRVSDTKVICDGA